jgi:hypothetical protein
MPISINKISENQYEFIGKHFDFILTKETEGDYTLEIFKSSDENIDDDFIESLSFDSMDEAIEHIVTY